MADGKPSGPLTGLLYEFDQQLQAAGTHAAAEGHSVGARTILESYDRTLHPWMHGRRAYDLVERYDIPTTLLGFLGSCTGLALGVVVYGPGIAYRALRRRVGGDGDA